MARCPVKAASQRKTRKKKSTPADYTPPTGERQEMHAFRRTGSAWPRPTHACIVPLALPIPGHPVRKLDSCPTLPGPRKTSASRPRACVLPQSRSLRRSKRTDFFLPCSRPSSSSTCHVLGPSSRWACWVCAIGRGLHELSSLEWRPRRATERAVTTASQRRPRARRWPRIGRVSGDPRRGGGLGKLVRQLTPARGAAALWEGQGAGGAGRVALEPASAGPRLGGVREEAGRGRVWGRGETGRWVLDPIWTCKRTSAGCVWLPRDKLLEREEEHGEAWSDSCLYPTGTCEKGGGWCQWE
jgi:hypothetical protein